MGILQKDTASWTVSKADECGGDPMEPLQTGGLDMNNIKPVNYRIHLEPDLRTMKFSGSTEILVEASTSVKEITLNAVELAFWGCKVRVEGEFVECPSYVDTREGEMRVCLPKEMAGRITLKMAYVGEINDKMVGFYRSGYGARGEEKYCAVTQFEESDARRVFPCFDHPNKKATFDIEMVVEEGLIAISNGPIAKEEPLGDGRKLVTFQQTPEMSTYLVFLGVGEFEFIEDVRKVLVRVGTMPGMTRHAGFALEFGRKALEFCEDYYDLTYPLPKLDMIAIPDFAAGAMENWGAITFRENLLLRYSSITSTAGEQRICEVIAHEIAHQWFGDLVTPSDWKYLWLNESFATYFGYGVVTHYYPEWGIWDQFLHGQTDKALDRDAFRETVPIELPGGKYVAINPSTAPIIYNKGASILRQVEGYVGKNTLREGLRHYLKKHEYACASSNDLWEALEEVSERPITMIMKSWVEQSGFPLVEVKRDGDRLSLAQRRFSYLPSKSRQIWIVPIALRVFYRNGDSRTITTLLEGKNTSVDIGQNAVAYKVNYGQAGFYRVKYSEKGDLYELGTRLLGKELPPEDRWGLQNDLYALVRRGDASVDEYLEFLSNYENEDAFLPLISIAGNLFHAYLVLEGAQRGKVASVGKSLLEKVLSNVGYEPRTDETPATSILRDNIIVHAVMYGSEDGAGFARSKFTSLQSGEAIHPDIMKSIMQVGALNGTDETFTWFVQRFKSSESEHERINILTALGSFSEKTLIEKTREYILTEVPDRNKFIPIDYLALNPYALHSMWEWYVAHVPTLEQLHPVHYERIIEAIVPTCGIGKEQQVKAFFEDYMREKEKARDVIKLALEKLEANSRMGRS
jgi:aminopeptidase N